MIPLCPSPAFLLLFPLTTVPACPHLPPPPLPPPFSLPPLPPPPSPPTPILPPPYPPLPPPLPHLPPPSPSPTHIYTRQTEYRQLTVCCQFPDGYPHSPLLVELKSKTISDQMLGGVVRVCDQELERHTGQPQV